MSDSPRPRRTRLGAAGGVLGTAAIAALVLGIGPAPSVLQLAGATRDDVADDISGNCDEAEHAGDPECAGSLTSGDSSTSSTVDDSTRTTVDDSTSTTAGSASPGADIRAINAGGAGTVLVAVDGNSLRLVAATPMAGWRVEVEQSAGREVELDFRSGTQRVQVNVEIEDGQVRERVRVRDDADDTDVRSENGVVVRDDSGDDNSNSGPGQGDDSADDDNSGHGGDDSNDDSADDDNRGSGPGGDDEPGDDHGSGGHGRDDG